MRNWITLLFFLLAAFAVAGIGGYATASSVQEWYPDLTKPSWNPPKWVFGPAWTLLFILMSVAIWRAWSRCRDQGQPSRSLLVLHGIQLGLNALWSILFFGLRRPDLALIEIFVLLLFLLALQVRLFRIDHTAGWLWSPYLAWVSFATTLNFAIWHLN
ncbi:TspO/MBR family protein [Puniceicoccus vermicola]|uniref:Tryptophan-rich sensory protein n=1 Tax=Puniceicoccus vermicola TaxID=388746 RepID=A0A7X1E6G9_9BACT|nr:TspO/MBR family protein [Puniceicoccus vermicola]MBC2604116.1 tryptophan-rich sensory protein [Puniceicoccus vermicola]